MARRKTAKRSKPKTMLRLPDLEQSKNAVLNSLAAPSSQVSYGHAIDEFIGCVLLRATIGFQPNCCPAVSVLPGAEQPRSLHHQRALGRGAAAGIPGCRHRAPEP